MRLILAVLVFSVLAVAGLMAVWLFGCGPESAVTWEYKEIGRKRSPDGKVDAILVTGDAGATTRTTTMVFLFPAGHSGHSREQYNCIFNADSLAGLNVEWRETRSLEIRYDKARVSSFKNFWDRTDPDGYIYTVEIHLKPTSDETSLPSPF